MPERTYTGPLPRGRVRLSDRVVPFTNGEPVEFTADEAAQLGPDWSAVSKKKAAKADPKPDEGTDTKEP